MSKCPGSGYSPHTLEGSDLVYNRPESGRCPTCNASCALYLRSAGRTNDPFNWGVVKHEGVLSMSPYICDVIAEPSDA